MTAAATNPAASKQFVLLVEPESNDASELVAHLVPQDLSFFVWNIGQPLRFGAEPPAAGPYFAMETIREDQQLRLLAAGCREAAMVVNALPAPPLTLLGTRDQVRQSGESRLLHVSLWLRPYLGVVPESVLAAGKVCGMCGEGFESGQRVYICPHCDSPTHAETQESKVGEHVLRCLEMTPTCPVCQQPVVLVEGPTWMPEVAHG